MLLSRVVKYCGQLTWLDPSSHPYFPFFKRGSTYKPTSSSDTPRSDIWRAEMERFKRVYIAYCHANTLLFCNVQRRLDAVHTG